MSKMPNINTEFIGRCKRTGILTGSMTNAIPIEKTSPNQKVVRQKLIIFTISTVDKPSDEYNLNLTAEPLKEENPMLLLNI
jgi:hypothetical protein